MFLFCPIVSLSFLRKQESRDKNRFRIKCGMTIADIFMQESIILLYVLFLVYKKGFLWFNEIAEVTGVKIFGFQVRNCERIKI